MVNKVDRAKQFLPFDALKGFREALREKEVEYEEKIELSEEVLKEIEEEFNKVEKGGKVKIRYYKNKQYVNIVGIVTNIDYIRKKIIINEAEIINFSDILAIKV